MNIFSSHWLMAHGCVKTSSRLRKWWLSAMRGYEVVNALEHPNRLILGHLTYTMTWVLKPVSRA